MILKHQSICATLAEMSDLSFLWQLRKTRLPTSRLVTVYFSQRFVMDGKEPALQESEDEYNFVNVNHETVSFGIEYRILKGYSLYRWRG